MSGANVSPIGRNHQVMSGAREAQDRQAAAVNNLSPVGRNDQVGKAMTDLTRWDVVVVGGANTDYLIRGKDLPRPGATIQGDFFQSAAGGKGANQAVAAARMGGQVAFVGRVGNDDRGDRIMEELDREG